MSAVPDVFLDGRVRLYSGDCLAILRELPSDSLDSCVTDPPYHLTSIVKRFGADGAAPAKVGQTGAYARASRGFMGQTWDGGDIAFRPELWAEVLRVLKPGAHLLAFSGTRTYHRMACAIEDAGFDIRDMTAWMYGSGFPKSHDVAKGIDKASGAVRVVIGNTSETSGRTLGSGLSDGFHGKIVSGHCRDITAPATDNARQWDGWGTALKPALEPIVLARKALDGTVVANVLKHGTGGLNIDACRIAGLDGADYTVKRLKPGATLEKTGGSWRPEDADAVLFHGKTKDGRWPANVLHDGSEEVIAAFPDSDGAQGCVTGREPSTLDRHHLARLAGNHDVRRPRGDAGSAARFFYSAKADADDRVGSSHPTVKPVDLMRYLVRLVTPKGGTTIDPFAGTGTTGEAAWREGFSAVLIEREAAYREDIARRMALCLAGPEERSRESVKARYGDLPAGPLFAMNEAAE